MNDKRLSARPRGKGLSNGSGVATVTLRWQPSTAEHPPSRMKVKLMIRDGRAEEAVVDLRRLPKSGDLITLDKWGGLEVISSLKTRANPQYEAIVIATRPQG